MTVPLANLNISQNQKIIKKMTLRVNLQWKTQFYKLISRNCRRLSTSAETSIRENDEYTKEPQYPQILDTSYVPSKKRQRMEWRDKIKVLKTVEEKLFAINMPRYYGFKSVIFNDYIFRYNSLPFFQYTTRTSLDDKGLPEYYNKLNEKVDGLLQHIKSDVEDAILFEYTAHKNAKKLFAEDVDPELQSRVQSSRIVSQINRVLINGLHADCSHLVEVDTDIDPRHDAFWFVGGIEPPEKIKKIRRNSWQKEYENDPVNRNYQYAGKPLLTLRHQYPLESPMEFENFSAADIASVPEYRLDAFTVGYRCEHLPAVTTPGFWPGSRREFGLLSYQSRDHIPFRNAQYGQEECQEAIHSKAIISSYAWLLGQACYQGFSTYHNPTYPLSTQTIITDGKLWSFYVYQLNTTELDIDSIEGNPKINQCWGTNEMKLFEEIDENGKLIGFNDDVLRNLMKFYINEPKERDINMKPYLGNDEQKVADIDNVERRIFLEEKYKHLVSGRPRHRLIPEVYAWEKIYKIDHNTKPLAARRRFFELGINPFQRTYDEHRPKYIPKIVRPGGKKNRNKLEKTYYPCEYPKRKNGYVETFNRNLINN